MAIIKCPECGHQISDKAPTCPSCGVEIAGHITHCQQCGAVYLSEQDSCPICHHANTSRPAQRMAPTTPPPIPTNLPPQQNGNATPEQPKKKHSRGALIFSFLMAMVICGVCFYFYHNAKDTKESEAYTYAMTSSDPLVLQSFLDTYRDASHARRDSIQLRLTAIQQAERDWTNACASKSKTVLLEFIKQYPQSAHKGEALNKIAALDPTINVEYSKELRQTILSGQGEQAINLVKWKLTNEYKLNVEFIAPKVPYRETITKVATAQYRHKKQSGGAGQFGEVHLLVCPYVEGEPAGNKFMIGGKETILNIKSQESYDLEWGGKLEFINCVVGGAIDLGFMPAILKGINDKMTEGPLTGSYARDIRVYVYDGKMHPVDSKEIAFIIAGRNAFKEAFRNAGPKILEPIYNVDIMTPNEYVGPCMSDLNGRRGMIMNQDMDRGFTILHARVPLAELYRYSTTLSSLTGGAATFTMKFADYQPVPADVQTKLLAEYAAQEQEED